VVRDKEVRIEKVRLGGGEEVRMKMETGSWDMGVGVGDEEQGRM
jgi:hypothetical protein